MNKPIRTISIFCLLLFLALMLNATYLQYFRAGALDEDPRNRRVIDAAFSARAGRHPRRPATRSPRACGRRPVRVPAAVPAALQVRPGHRLLLLLQPDRHRAVAERGALRRRLPAVRHPARRPAQQLQPEGRQGPAHGRPGGPGRRLRRPRGARRRRPGRRGRARAEHRQGPGDGLQPDVRPQRAGLPRLRRGRGRRRAAAARTRAEPMLNRAIQTTLPPGSTFKLVTAAAALESGNYPTRTRWCPAADLQLPLTTGAGLVDNGGRACGGDRIPMIQAMEQSCNTSFAPLADELGADAMREQAEALRLELRVPRGPAAAGESRLPRRPGRGRRRRCPASASSSVTATPLQMAMVVAAVANGGMVMRPYVVDEVRSPSSTSWTRPSRGAALPGGLAPRRPSELTEMMVSTVANGTASPAADPRRQRRPARPAPPRAATPTCRRTPGSCRSPRPTTRRSRSP